MAKDKESKKKLPKSLEEQRTRMVCSDRNYNVRTRVVVRITLHAATRSSHFICASLIASQQGLNVLYGT